MANNNKHTGPNVPALRFPEFSGEWEKVLLSSACEINPKTGSLDNQFLYIDLESVVKGSLVKRQIIEKDGAPSRAQRVLKENDILYQCVRPYQLNNYIFEGDTIQCVASTGYAQLRTTQFPLYSFQALHTKQFTNQVLERCTGTNYPAINSSDLGTVEVPICSLPEQVKIGSLLALIDSRIKTQSKIIEDKETLYKAIIDKHFKEIRKNESIQEVYLSNVFKERVEYSSNDGVFPHASLTKEGVNIKTDRYNRDFLVKDTDKQYKVTRINDICYNPANLKFGVITRNKVGTLIFSPIYVTFEVRNGYDPAYIELMVTNSDFVNKMLRFQEGTVYERMAVSSEDFLSESCKIPDLEIQKEFSAHVSIIEQSIQVEKKYLESICRIKNFILEAMFI